MGQCPECLANIDQLNVVVRERNWYGYTYGEIDWSNAGECIEHEIEYFQCPECYAKVTENQDDADEMLRPEIPEPKRYNHAFDVAFQLDSDFAGEDVPANELIVALEKRVMDLRADYTLAEMRGETPEILEACGLPYDTYEKKPEEQEKGGEFCLIYTW